MHKLDDVTDRQGRSIGCILERDDMIMAIRPNGDSRECGNRSSAVWWLEEKAAGRDPERRTRGEQAVDWVVMGITVLSLIYYLYLWLAG
jgi:hypothetical protein